MTTTTVSVSYSAPQRALALAVLGVISALISNFYGITAEYGRLFATPTMPGVYFGIVLALGAWMWATQSVWRFVAIEIAVIAIWIIAFQSTMNIDLALQETLKPLDRAREFWITAGSGLCGGAIGGALSAAAIAWLCKTAQPMRQVVRTGVIGALAGTLLVFFDDNKGFAPVALPDNLQLLPLFIVWQPTVAASIGWGLSAKPDL